MVIMSVDLGRARTGLALCDKGEILAYPAGTVQEYDETRLLEKIAAQAMAHKVEGFVVGLPKNMDGTEGESAIRARAFGALLSEKTGLPVAFQDERKTTVTAHGYLNDTNTRGKKRKAVIDTVAATVILEAYLQGRRQGQ